ncbi:MAG: hypothetical protein KJ558_11325, partial [Gammaproteobacteria bacterium]|nr:hypothetical protein [Gammaproteobacteria bacterium]MBU1655398.1 hypothetical protein [Gammaproteobacteria bacterium]MBU1960806.1 hypothetical protein [Gammaproteobacteria bacterium]
MNTNEVETSCAATILGMVPWRAGDRRGEFVPVESREREDQDQTIRLDEEALATIERMDFDPETVLRHGDEEGISEQNEWPLEGGPDSWRRHLDRDSLPRRITTAPSNFIWLGRYFPMAPEGLIQLHQERLGY